MLRRALVAEGLGSLLLAATVFGSGIMAQRLAGGNVAVALLANTAATVAVLATLIALFGSISGAHFNPARGSPRLQSALSHGQHRFRLFLHVAGFEERSSGH